MILLSRVAPSIWAALLYLLIRAALWPLLPIPEPYIHDERSYVLAADTFVRGRLANPPHPMGRFFESPHVLIAPTYASVYQPGQGLVLAIGQAVFGDPYFGVVLGCALLCGVWTHTVQVWINRRWAWVAAITSCAIVQPGFYWGFSYWGGQLAASAAAFALIGLGHLVRRRAPAGLPHFAIAASVLALIRPFEGIFFMIAVCAVALWLCRGRDLLMPVLRVNLPILLFTACFQLYYDFRVTGSPWVVPYLLHDKLYAMFRIFWFLPLHPPLTYGHPRLEEQHGRNGYEVYVYMTWQSIHGLAFGYRLLSEVFRAAVRSWLGVPLGWLLVGLGLPMALRTRKTRLLVGIAAVAAIPHFLVAFHSAHYAAPLIATLFLLSIFLLRSLASVRIGEFYAGRPIAAILVLIVCLQSGMAISSVAENFNDPLAVPKRSSVALRLGSLPGKHLVVIRYPQGGRWNLFLEWVYNTAEPDSSPIVYAHDLGSQLLPTLQSYYRDRHAWLLEFSEDGSYTLNPL